MDSWCTWEPSAVALPTGIQPVGGQVRCRLWAVGWGGGLVVVRARERRVHGEGGQQVSSRGTGRPGGVAGEYRRPGLRLVRGGAPGTGDSDQAAPLGREPSRLRDLWSARCGESRTTGAGSGPRKRAGRKTGTAPRPDFTCATRR